MTSYRKLIFVLCAAVSSEISAQNSGNKSVSISLPVVALLNVVPPDPISISFTSPTEAGNTINNPGNDESKWLNYSSAIPFSGSNRVITAMINENISGITLRVEATGSLGSGGGQLGISAGRINLNTNPQMLIYNIGGAFTGIGTGDGHRLIYSAVVNDYKNVSVTQKTINVIYTISDL